MSKHPLRQDFTSEHTPNNLVRLGRRCNRHQQPKFGKTSIPWRCPSPVKITCTQKPIITSLATCLRRGYQRLSIGINKNTKNHQMQRRKSNPNATPTKNNNNNTTPLPLDWGGWETGSFLFAPVVRSLTMLWYLVVHVSGLRRKKLLAWLGWDAGTGSPPSE